MSLLIASHFLPLVCGKAPGAALSTPVRLRACSGSRPGRVGTPRRAEGLPPCPPGPALPVLWAQAASAEPLPCFA